MLSSRRELSAAAHGRAAVSAWLAVAREREQDDRAAGLRAASARYDTATDFVMIALTNGLLLGFPASAMPGLAGATPAQRAALELSPSGAGIHWEALDADVSVSESQRRGRPMEARPDCPLIDRLAWADARDNCAAELTACRDDLAGHRAELAGHRADLTV
ncbi:MAG: DUF2442 domain-containing protein [Gemmatimonadaceae bacterium]